MPTLAIAILKNVEMGDELVQYINHIDETLLRFDGRFLVHGETAELLEGNWNSDLVIIQFPDREHVDAEALGFALRSDEAREIVELGVKINQLDSLMFGPQAN